MSDKVEIITKNNDNIKVQRVKNYDAKDLPSKKPKQTKTASKNSASSKENIAKTGVNKPEEKPKEPVKQENNPVETKASGTKTTPNGQTATLMGKNATNMSKFLICMTYIFGAFSVLYFLSSWWYFLGMVGVVFPLVILIMSKTPSVKQASGRVFFVNLATTILSAIFWVIYLTTFRYGIGFVNSLFRALQMISAFVGVALVMYYFLDFLTAGKTSLPWLAKITQKAERKAEDFKQSKAKAK